MAKHSEVQAEKILATKSAVIKDFEIDENEFLRSAENINQILHNGAINKDYRARVISALLLALAEGSNVDLSVNPALLIQAINLRVNLILKKHGKQDFSKYIKLDLPASEDNHIKFSEAIAKTIQELLELNIHSAMKSGKDILGKFYEVFLKYGNGAKEIGIVLTPRHITRYVAEIMQITADDLVLDPACGTGGFLVAALDEVKRTCSSDKKFEIFKQCGIYGIEEQDPVVALALVNMIFRGNGKNNIIEGNCFNKWLNLIEVNGVSAAEYCDANTQNRIPPITKVLMNPPFVQKGAQKKEYHYVEQALNQMQDEGILFAILPLSVLVRGGEELAWRKSYLLKHHTILSIVTFPEGMFYPVNIMTLGILIKKGVAHLPHKNVFWAKVNCDGFAKSKGKRLISSKATNQFEEIKKFLIRAVNEEEFLVDKLKFYVTKPIDFSDEQLELIPEVYLNEGLVSIKGTLAEIDKVARELIAFLIVSQRTNNPFLKFVKTQKTIPFNAKINYKIFKAKDIFSYIKAGRFHASGDLAEGKIPLISCKTIENGTEGYFDINKKKTFDHCITIASDGKPMSSFYHPYEFSAKDNVVVCKPNDELGLKAILFITAQLNSQMWRFSYGRKCYLNRVDKIEIPLPVNQADKIDFLTIDAIVDSCPIWSELEMI